MKVDRISSLIIGSVLACSVLASSGCSKKDEDDRRGSPPATNVQTQPSPPPKAPTAPPGPDLADEDVPVETDFEEAAAQEISAETYRQELDKLEKEIAGSN